MTDTMRMVRAPAAIVAGLTSATLCITDRPVPLACDITGKVSLRGAPLTRVGWQKHAVVRLGGARPSSAGSAEFRLLSAEWPYSNAQMPYLVSMPERKRLLMSAEVGAGPVHTVLTASDDHGRTWSSPRWMHTDDAGRPDFTCVTGLTHLSGGRLIASSDTYWLSGDFGQTWGNPIAVPKGAEGKPMYGWDPMLVDRDRRTGKITRLMEARYKENGTFDTAGYFSQAAVRCSLDEGKTWSAETEVPAWRGVNEVALVRANNGDIVAACRTDNPRKFLGLGNDQYSGLATSVSHDNGRTWTALNWLFHWGRHHPSMIVLPKGEIVMTYVVRNGYSDDSDGFPRFGVEAVVSRDNGATWDLDHRYILASWTARIKNTWWGSSQSTTTVRLPDGALLTAFGTGMRNVPEQTICKMDVAMVKWKPSSRPADPVTTIRGAFFGSDLRNKLDLDSVR